MGDAEAWWVLVIFPLNRACFVLVTFIFNVIAFPSLKLTISFVLTSIYFDGKASASHWNGRILGARTVGFT